tara:strand:- start:12861 stop:13064 length:204 start_codon:yes stop_codon:yes gene_type:complete
MFLELLLQLFWLPYELLTKLKDNSRLGNSPQEEDNLKFWKGCAMFATAFVLIPLVVLLGAWYYISHR